MNNKFVRKPEGQLTYQALGYKVIEMQLATGEISKHVEDLIGPVDFSVDKAVSRFLGIFNQLPSSVVETYSGITVWKGIYV